MVSPYNHTPVVDGICPPDLHTRLYLQLWIFDLTVRAALQVRNGDGDTSPKCRLFRGLPRGFTVFPCLSMCNAGQVIFMKYGE